MSADAKGLLFYRLIGDPLGRRHEFAAWSHDQAIAIAETIRLGHYSELWCGDLPVRKWAAPDPLVISNEFNSDQHLFEGGGQSNEPEGER